MLSEFPIKLIQPDPRSSNEWSEDTVTKLKNNIQRTGFVPPLVLMRYRGGKGSFRVIDGHLRLLIVKELGWEKVPAIVCTPKDETEVELLLATLNSLRGTENIKKRAVLINSLSQVIPVSDLASLVPEDVDQIKDLIALARIEFEDIERAVKEQVQKEEETLPVPYHFMVAKSDAQVVDQALHQALSDKTAKKKDFSKAFVSLCQTYLAHQQEQQDGKE